MSYDGSGAEPMSDNGDESPRSDDEVVLKGVSEPKGVSESMSIISGKGLEKFTNSPDWVGDFVNSGLNDEQSRDFATT